VKLFVDFDRKVSRPDLSGQAGSLPTGRQEGARYEVRIHYREAPGVWPGSFKFSFGNQPRRALAAQSPA